MASAGRHLREWAVLLLLLGLLLTAAIRLGWTERADNWIYDTGVSWSGRAAGPDILIVAIDEASLAQLGRWPWSRQQHAAMLERLHAAGAGAVLLDVILSEPQRDDPQADVRLAAAIAAHGRVVLPVFMSGAEAVLPLPQFARHAQLGHAQALVDRDGVTRRYLVRESVAGMRYDHVAAVLLRQAGASPAYPSGMERSEQVLVPFSGPAGHYPRVAAADLLAGTVPASLLRGKTVLLGATATGLGDNLVTPLAGRNGVMPGVEFVANVFDALRGGRFVLPVAPAWHLAGSVVLLLLLMAALLLTTPRIALLVTVAAVFSTLLLGWLLLERSGRWWPPAAPAAAMALAYPLWSWRRLEASLATMTRETARIAALVRPGGGAVLASTGYLDPVQTRIAAISGAVDRIAQALTLDAGASASRRQRDDMMRHLAHDLRSPLISLRSLADQLRGNNTQEHVAMLERMDACARRSLDLTEQFLLLGRAEALDPADFTDVDLVQLLHQCADDLWEDAQGSGARVQRQCAEDIAVVRGDARLLQRAVLNLGWNALRHGPPGGVVTLSLQLEPGACLLSVHDQGPGFAPGALAQPSQHPAKGKGARAQEGYGLGLALVRLVAEKHQASLQVEQAAGGGFCIGLRIVYSP